MTVHTAGETIAAIATPPGEGALAVIRVSGPDSSGILHKVFRPSRDLPPPLPARRPLLGRIVNAEGKTLDQVVVTFYCAPSSYTGEDMAEISCHGGITVTRLLLDALLAAGARVALPGEFTERAFLNGKLDLTQAEAVMDLISAQTAAAARSAAEQLEGGLGRRIHALRDQIVAILAHTEAYIDFPEEDISPETGEDLIRRLEEVLGTMQSLLETAERGRILREGARLVIAGPPNSGKSSLLNLLLGYDRAIVNERPGTTRDTIEEVIDLGGYPVRLVDTAGLRNTEDTIEQDGISRTHQRLATADLVLKLFDASLPPPDIESLFARQQKDCENTAAQLLVLNKSDLPEDSGWQAHPEALRISCRNKTGLDALEEAILRALPANLPRGSASLIAINARHRVALAHASSSCRLALDNLRAGQPPEIIALDLHEALSHLGAVIGATDTEDILGEIFRSFCIGK